MIGKLLFGYIADFKLENLNEYTFSVKDLIAQEKEKLVSKVIILFSVIYISKDEWFFFKIAKKYKKNKTKT